MDLRRIFPKVFMWLGIGLLITFLTGYVIATNENMIEFIYTNDWFLLLTIILEFGTVIFLSARIKKMNVTTANISFILYAFFTGITFSSIFIVYELSSIIYIFGITALILLLFSLFGYFTKIDLTKFGSFLFMILLGIIIASIVNIFIGSETLNLGIIIISILVFIIFIAFDIQKVKRLLEYGEFEGKEDNLAIYGALQLYLDFINIFIDLLRLFGKRNN